jgi:hypothetical protein
MRIGIDDLHGKRATRSGTGNPGIERYEIPESILGGRRGIDEKTGALPPVVQEEGTFIEAGENGFGGEKRPNKRRSPVRREDEYWPDAIGGPFEPGDAPDASRVFEKFDGSDLTRRDPPLDVGGRKR